MMEEIVNQVLRKLTEFTPDALNSVKSALYIVLNKYDITLQSTDLRVIDDSWVADLRLFCERKRMTGKSEATIERYRYILSRVLGFINKPTKDITEGDLNEFLETYKRLRCVSNSTLEGTRLCISSFFTWLHERGYIKKNPSKGVDPIKVPKAIKRAYSDEELEKIKQHCFTLRDKAIVEFLYTTGVRISELTALNREDIRVDEKAIIVYGKGAKEREVYMTDVSCMYLSEYLRQRKDESEALFVSNKAPYHRLSPSGVRSMLKKLGETARIEKVHPHRFRTTCATNLLRKGMPIEEVSQILGHEKLDTTRLYALVDRDKVKADHRRYMAA